MKVHNSCLVCSIVYAGLAPPSVEICLAVTLETFLVTLINASFNGSNFSTYRNRQERRGRVKEPHLRRLPWFLETSLALFENQDSSVLPSRTMKWTSAGVNSQILFHIADKLRHYPIRFPPRRPGFEAGSRLVRFVLDKVGLGQVFSEYF